MTAGKGEPAEVAKATLMDHSSLITTREFINELGNRIKITIEGPNSSSENILTPLEAIELSHGLNEMKQALAADRTKLLALGADPGPTENEFFGNGIMNLNSALDLAEDMTVAPGYGDIQDALGVLAKAYRKAEDRIGDLLVKNDAKAAALDALVSAVGERQLFKYPLLSGVRKHEGSYQLDGLVRAQFFTGTGQPRYVVDHEPIAPGLLHIYAEHQLRALPAPPSEPQRGA